MGCKSMDYILSGTFVSGVVTNIGPSGTTYELLDYGLPKPSQQWVGSAYTVNSNNNGVEEGIEVFLKFDGTDGDQLDVYAVKYIRFNTKTYREKNYLTQELRQPTQRVSGVQVIFDFNVEGITQSGAAIIRSCK